MTTKPRQQGFTLLEILIALVLLTVISVVLVGSLGPWLSFKQKLDTERKLNDLKTAFTLAYDANAMTAEGESGALLKLATGTVAPTTQGGTQCVADPASWQALANFLPDGPQSSQLDGYGAPWCVLINPQQQTVINGAPVYFHTVAIVSTGRSGRLDPTTRLDPETGALTLGGDNMGVLVSGYAVQKTKLEQTQARLDKLASLYETYFTAQYLGNPARDIMVDYFATSNPTGAWDNSGAGTVGGTQGQLEVPALTLLGSVGAGEVETTSAYETANQIYLANFNECIQGTCVRSSADGLAPPYTALLYAPLPGPAGTYLVKTVMGNY